MNINLVMEPSERQIGSRDRCSWLYDLSAIGKIIYRAPRALCSRQPMEREMENRIPSIIDLNAELAKLTMFRGLTPITTREERRGSATLLGPYRDGILFAGKTCSWARACRS